MFKLYFLNSWNNFSETIPCNWEVIKLSINHKEGHVAKANLTVTKYTRPKNVYLAIFEDNTLLFQGILSGQSMQNDNLTTIDAICIAPSFEADLSAILKSGALVYNRDFFQGTQPKASDYLEACNQLFYWNRTSGVIALSDYFKGKQCIDVAGNYLKGSLHSQQINMPLGKVAFELKVIWTQNLEGSFNAAPYIAREFPHGVITTLTPKAITTHWPKTDQRLGAGKRKSGYRVEHSSIHEITDIQTMVGKLPNRTRPFFSGYEKSQCAKIYYFKADLKIAWEYQQMREEMLVLQASLNHEQHHFTTHKIRRIPITIHLPNSENAVFFETSYGRHFFEYAKRLVISQLRASARCKQVTFKVPWQLGRGLTVDDSVRLELPGKKDAVGKVTGVNLVVSGMQRFVEVTLGCVIDKGNLKQKQINAQNEYFEENWDEEIASSCALAGIPYPNLNPKDLIQEVIVKNAAHEQENYLMLNQYPARDNLQAALAKVPTSIYLNMRDLRTEQILRRNFNVELPVVDPPV